MRRLPESLVLGPVIASGVLAAAAAATHGALPLVLVNESRSLPRGCYLRSPGEAPHRAAVVAVRQPASARPYLAGLGMPPEVALLKRVAAVAGDRVCARAGFVDVAGRVLPVHDRDRLGIALPAWRGCRPLAAGELFVIGDTPESFDSRYFGPVAQEQVEGVFREVARW